MTNHIKNKRKQSSLIHQKIRNAAFVPVEPTDSERVKYFRIPMVSRKISEIRLSLKRHIKTIMQKPLLWASFVDWKIVKRDLTSWLVESVLEGLTANFATHYLLGWNFNVFTVLAHGFAIKQGLSIYWRLRKDGTISKIPEKDE